MKRYLYAFILLAAAPTTSCSDNFLDVTSTESVDQAQIFATTEAATTAINGMHRLMFTKTNYAPRMGYSTYMLWNDFMGEDLVYTKKNAQWGSSAQWVLHRNPTSGYNSDTYAFFYKLIANANMVIANIDQAEGPQATKDFIKGEALGYRAFAHFCLVQWYGERYYAGKVNSQDGIIVRTDNSLEAKARSSVEEVYSQVNEDLDAAISLLDGNPTPRNTINDIDVHVARALKARVLLTQSRWEEAAATAQLVVEKSGAQLDASTYDFKQGRMCNAGNKEWIWGKIGSVDVDGTSSYRLFNFFSYISNTNVSYNYNSPRAIYNLLYEKISATDVRKKIWLPDAPTMNPKEMALPPKGNVFKWISQKFIVDYPDNSSASYNGSLWTADLAYCRLPEMMLIMAEAYARAGLYQEAAQALYPLAKHRDPEYRLSTQTGQALIDEIMVQRRVELWGEGFRFLDLKRLNMALDRGPKPRDGYNQGGASNNWKNKKNPTNLDPLASNFNMYDEQPIGESSRYFAADNIIWQFAIPQTELDSNPLCNQNPL